VPRGARKVGMGASLAAEPVPEGFRGHTGRFTIRTVTNGRLVSTFSGYLAGVVLGVACLTMMYLGMRSVMEIGGACAEGGPYVPVRPCPDGAPLALIGGSFGLFAAAGLMIWFGSRLGGRYVFLVFLGWPALFVSLGFNFLQFGLNPPEGGASPEWGFLIPGILFWIIGLGPLLFVWWGWRAARGGRPEASSAVVVNRLRQSVTLPEGRIEYAPNSFGSPRPAASTSDDPADAVVEELERLSRLHDAGSLTDDEFAAAKARILTSERLA